MSYTINSTQTSSGTISASSILNNGVTLTVPANLTTNTVYTVTGSNGMSYDDLKPHTLHVQGSAVFHGDTEFNGNVTVNGVDLAQAIKDIEARLNILRPNHKLEAEWDELRELGERYRQMERDMLEKIEMVEMLKKKY